MFKLILNLGNVVYICLGHQVVMAPGIEILNMTLHSPRIIQCTKCFMVDKIVYLTY